MKLGHLRKAKPKGGTKMGTERFTIGSLTIPIVKRSFLKLIFLKNKKEHFTIGIVKNL